MLAVHVVLVFHSMILFIYALQEKPNVESEFYTGNQYKKEVLEMMSAEQLVDVVLCRPTVKVRHSFRDTGFTASYSFNPLTNLQFTRDQQVSRHLGLLDDRQVLEHL